MERERAFWCYDISHGDINGLKIQLYCEDPMLHRGNGTLKKKDFFLEVDLEKQIDNNNLDKVMPCHLQCLSVMPEIDSSMLSLS